MRGRHIAVGLSLLMLAAGCGGVTSGTAVPDPVVAKMPRLTPDKIPDVMLTVDEMNKLVAAKTLAQKFENTVPTVPNFTYSKPECAPMFYTGDSETYGDKWNGYRLRSLQEPGDDYQHAIYQTVTTFKNFLQAEAMVTQYTDTLAKCRDKDVTSTSQDGKATKSTLRVNQVPHTTDASATSVDWTLTPKDSSTWVCSFTMRTQGNVLIEISSCAYADSRTSAVIADRIATKIRQI
ncbi:sensor domain-containing protein [Nocardia jejuensis]|uniref:sensor domain-containing protein n=1 Tax=Nocardia jejuensis TaxID=328049 RepID=UPI00082C8797|nr:sensor domain-containing protein [Nocardia jejuensis]